MAKIVRHSYPRELSIGLLLLVFTVSFFLSGGIFEKHQPHTDGLITIMLGEFLVATSTVIMVVILWEEVLFPVKVKPAHDGGMIFRNHRTKLVIQALIYLTLPVIVVFLIMNYSLNPFRFYPWALICLVAPIVGKLASGINNYNDFLKLTPNTIEYQNNKEIGLFELKEISSIILIKDETNVLHKIDLHVKSKGLITIDLDEMELEAYYETIDHYISLHYKDLMGKVG